MAIVGLQPERGRRLAKQIQAAGGSALAIGCDVSREAAVRGSITRTVKSFGRLDVLVNNAGIVQVKPLHRCTERDWDRIMAVNVKAMFFAMKHALRPLRRAGDGCIVNVGSISSFVGQSLTPAYTTSKHAVVGLTRSIALDYAADGVRCNCVCPGITDTPMLREHLNMHPDPDAVLAARLKRVPLGIALTPQDVARAILFLSCADSAGITGTTLTIDAGYLTAAEWNTGG